MPERTHDFGHYGARGVKGSEAVVYQLDNLAGYITTPHHRTTRPHGTPQLSDQVEPCPPSRARGRSDRH